MKSFPFEACSCTHTSSSSMKQGLHVSTDVDTFYFVRELSAALRALNFTDDVEYEAVVSCMAMYYHLKKIHVQFF